RDPARVLVPEDRAGPGPSLHDAVQVGAADPAVVDRDHHFACGRDGHRTLLDGDGSVDRVDRGLHRTGHAPVGPPASRHASHPPSYSLHELGRLDEAGRAYERARRAWPARSAPRRTWAGQPPSAADVEAGRLQTRELAGARGRDQRNNYDGGWNRVLAGFGTYAEPARPCPPRRTGAPL